MTRVITSKPINPSQWLVLKQKARQALITHSKEEIHAAHARTTRRMEHERISGAIYGTTPGFRKHAHTEGMAGLYGNISLARSLIPSLPVGLSPKTPLA